ncbi:integrator complex subunit 6-like [Ctenocephalides felis]|uniref:integrator complex subunit 6-like n=1 Tax=Ctenocephalides felis TaxID=7515 RepID=UPI000E6E33A9|nr:integrator complex subunit 6-like [Ctenocephalides felis]
MALRSITSKRRLVKNTAALPPRSAHPNVKFTCTSQEPMVIENLPFDKYELEPSPLTQYILARKQPTVCWQIFVANSSKSGEIGHPFGYLKASTNLSCVNMFVMPYNYPVLLPLLEELFKVHRCKPSNDWKTHFGNYLRTMPPYYAAVTIKRALIRMGAPAPLASALITDSMENSLSYLVLNYLKRAKTQAKIEFDKLCNDVISKQNNGKHGVPNETVRVVARSPFKKDLLSHPQLQDKFSQLREQLNDFSGFVVNLSKSRQKSSCSFRNPFDISRSVLLDQVVRMRANFLQPSLSHTQLIDDDSLHSMPVGQMGNYQEHLKRMTPQLRELESQPVRQHMFGNPFKIDKRMMVDEADIDLVGSTSKSPKRLTPMEPASPRINNKRKAGPLPRDFRFSKPESPIHETSSYPSSPSLSPSSHVYTPASPISSGYSNPVLLPPVYTMSSELIASLGTPVVTIAPMQNLESGIVSPSWSSLGSSSLSTSIQTSNNLLNPLDDIDLLNPMSSQDLQDNGGRLQIDYRFVNGDSKNVQAESTRSPSPTLPYNPEPGNGDRPLPTYSNHVKNSSSIANLSQEKQISMILQEVNSNGGDFTKRSGSISNSKKSTNGPVEEAPRKKNTKQDLLDIKKHNLSVRKLVYKEVRRPGRNFAPLFDHLETMQGTLDVRVLLVKEIIKECLRFKRKTLASLLEEFLKRIQNGLQPKLKDLYQAVANKSLV